MKFNTYIEEVPVYIPGVTAEELAKSHGFSGDEIVKLSSNENPLGPSPLAINAIKKEASSGHIYPDNSYKMLKEKIAEKTGVRAENIAVGNGSSEIFLFLSLVFLNDNSTLVTSRHTFQLYRISGKIVGADVRLVPMKDYRYDLEAIKNSIDGNVRAVYICNPNNPTGTYLSHEEVREFLDSVPDDVIIVFDEAYYEYVTAEDYPVTTDFIDRGNVVIIRTFSKIYGIAGLRLGYAITSPEIVEKFEHVRFPFNVSRVAQAAGIASLDDEEHVLRSRSSNERNRVRMYKKFEELGVKYLPSQGNFVYVQTHEKGIEIFNRLLEYGVIVRPLDAFGLPEGIRVTVGDDYQTHRFLEAFEKVL